MIKYIGKRILMLIPVLLGVVLLVFSMMYFSPGNAEDYILGDMATEEDKEAFREENGLNKPFFIQYINYVKDALQGDLGISYTTKQPVSTEIFKRFPTTFKLALLSTLLVHCHWNYHRYHISSQAVFHHGSCDSLDRNAWCISSYILGGPDADHFVFCPIGTSSCFWIHHMEALDFTVVYDRNPFSSHCNAYDALQHAGSDSPGLYYNGKIQRTDKLCSDYKTCFA